MTDDTASDAFKNLLEDSAKEAYSRPWHRIERGLRLNRLRIFIEDVAPQFTMTKEEKIEHVELLESLLDKQKVLYTRMSLSDDPEAKEMKDRIVQSAIMMGMPPNTDMNIILNNMSKMLDLMKHQIDKNDPD